MDPGSRIFSPGLQAVPGVPAGPLRRWDAHPLHMMSVFRGVLRVTHRRPLQVDPMVSRESVHLASMGAPGMNGTATKNVGREVGEESIHAPGRQLGPLHLPGIMARGELWLGTADPAEGKLAGGVIHADPPRGGGEGRLGVPLLGHQHGPRILELLRDASAPETAARETHSHLRQAGGR